MPVNVLSTVLGPLLGLLIISLGNGFLSSLTTLRLDAAGVSVTITGAVSSAYYIGLTLGAVFSDRLIMRIGHIRAYSSFASLIAVTILLQGLFFESSAWFVLRFLCGWATVGLYLVIESWLLMAADKAIRGRLLALYMIALYGSGTAGQAALGFINGLGAVEPFLIAGVLASLSVLPVVIIPRVSPLIERIDPVSLPAMIRATPTGVIGCFGSGIAIAAIYTLLPLYLQHEGLNVRDVGFMMSSVILGAMVLQYPVGRWSDMLNRQIVLISLGGICAVISVVILLITPDSWLMRASLFLLGGLVFSIYPVSVSHSSDIAPAKNMVRLIQGMLLVNSLGSAISPMIIAPVMKIMGVSSIFWILAILHVFLMIFFIWRRNERPAPTPVSTFDVISPMTPVGAELLVQEEVLQAQENSNMEDK